MQGTPRRRGTAALYLCALLMLSAPRVCIADETPGSDGVGELTVAALAQDQTGAEVEDTTLPADAASTETTIEHTSDSVDFMADPTTDSAESTEPAVEPSEVETEQEGAPVPARVATKAPADSAADADSEDADAEPSIATGWGTLPDGRTCYYGEDGQPVKWVQVIDGKQYYFDADGAMWTGWLTWVADKTRSYFDTDGAALSGWQTVGGKKYYFDAENSCHGLRWLQKVDDKSYYFDGSCAMQTGWVTWNADRTRSYFDPDGIGEEYGAAVSDWRNDGSKRYYIDPSTLRTVRWAHTLDGKYYYFDADCHMWTGWLTWAADKSRSYFGSDGAALSGWQTVGGKRYYFDPKNSFHGYRWAHTLDGKYYYFDGSCAMQTGWVAWNSDKSRSYFGADGAALSGWQTVGGKRYYFDPKNGCHGLRWVQALDGRMYYFDGSCAMQTGWVTWNADKTRSYFDPDSASATYGAALSGWRDDGAKRYYIDPSTLHAVRWLQTLDGKMYYFDGSCAMQTGWVTWNADKSRSYFDSDSASATYGAALSGWRDDGAKRYYIEPKTLHTVRWRYDVGGGKLYYFQGDYSLVTRQWIKFKDNTAPSWADSEGLLTQVPGASLDSTGKLKGAKPGWLFLGSDRFFIKSDGTPYTKWMTSGTNRYWFTTKTGAAAESVTKIGDYYYYFSPTTQAMETGWKTVGTHTYYFDPSTGKAYTSSHKVDGKMHYFDTNGWEFTALQLKLIKAAKKTPTTPAGYCSEWISNVFKNAGIATFGGDACDQYRWYCHSSNRSELRAGMIVAVSKHSNTRLGRIYGHVCLYIGDGKIMDSIGRVRTMDLQPWLDHYGNMVTPKWGWGGDVALV